MITRIWTWVRSHRRLWLILFMLFLLYAGALFFGGPILIRRAIEDGARSTGSSAEVSQIRLNPFTLCLTVRGLKFLHDNEPLLELPEGFVNLQISSLFRLGVVIREAALNSPSFNLKRKADGSLNLPAAKGGAEGDAEKGEPLRVLVDSFKINNGSFTFTGESQGKEPFVTRISQILVAVTGVDTKGEKPAEVRVQGVSSENERLELAGGFNATPLGTKGSLNLSQIDLAHLSLLAAGLPAAVSAGRADVALDYEAGAGDFNITNARLDFRDVAVKDKESGEELAHLAKAEAKQIRISLKGRKVEVGSLSLADGKVSGVVGQDGKMNFQKLGAQQNPDQTPDKGIDTGPAWQVVLERLDARNLKYQHQDRTFEPAFQQTIELAEAALQNIRSGKGGGAEGKLLLKSGEGEFQADVKLVLEPLNAEAQVSAKNIDLAPFSPYFGKFLNVELMSGKVETDGKFTYGTEVKYQGAAALRGLRAQDKQNHEQFLTWESVEAKDMELSPGGLRTSSVTTTGTEGNLTIRKDGTVNVSSLIVQRAQKQAIEHPTEAPPFDLQIGDISIAGSKLNFRHETERRPVILQLVDLKGKVKPSPGMKIIDVDVKGKLAPSAPVTLTGQLNLESRAFFNRLVFKISGAQLVSLNPYMLLYTGREASGGDYGITLDYKVDKEKLKGDNTILLKKVKLAEAGKPVEGGNEIPMDLVLSLLRRPDGDILLQFSAEGDPRAPEFSFKEVIFGALWGTLKKIIASPFSVLASLTGGGEELDKIEFAFGSDEIVPETQKKLAALAKAMNERPAIKLSVPAAADSTRDRWSLAGRSLDEKLGGSLEQLGAEQYARRIVSRRRKSGELPQITDRKPPQRFVDDFAAAGKIAPPEELAMMKLELLRAEGVTDQALQELGKRRAENVRGWLATNGKIDPSRVVAGDPAFVQSEGEKVVIGLGLAQ